MFRVLAGDGLAPAGAALEHARKLSTRIQVAGGEVVIRAGSSVGATFDALELLDVVELALEALAEARGEGMLVNVACALALGEVESEDGVAVGAAVDRVLVLAGRAGSFELVLDDAARAQADATLLFARSVSTRGIPTAHVVDARYPHRAPCRKQLARLSSATLPDAKRILLAPAGALLDGTGAALIAVRAPQASSALDVTERVLREHAPALQLTLGSTSRGLAPLGGLQAALRTMSAPSLLATLPAAHRGVLARCAALDAVEREAVIEAFAALLVSASAHGRIVALLPAVHELDPPSLAVLLAAVEQSRASPVVVVPLDETASVPPLLGRIAELVTVSLGALDSTERVEVAASVLGGVAEERVLKHVALLGGDSVLGVVEAARTLVAAGDIVLVDGVWRFRAEPRAAHQPIPIEALLAERLLGLDDHAHRVLEAACLAPPGTPRDLAERIARLDGLPPEAVARGRRILREEGLTDEAGRLGALAASVRDAVRNAMPSARAAELSRFAASALEDDLAALPRSCFGRALLAHYLAEGGRESDAARQLIEAAEAAVESGFPTSALRLAALARKLDASAEGTERARAMSVDIARAAARDSQPRIVLPGPDNTGEVGVEVAPLEERSRWPAATVKRPSARSTPRSPQAVSPPRPPCSRLSRRCAAATSRTPSARCASARSATPRAPGAPCRPPWCCSRRARASTRCAAASRRSPPPAALPTRAASAPRSRCWPLATPPCTARPIRARCA